MTEFQAPLPGPYVGDDARRALAALQVYDQELGGAGRFAIEFGALPRDEASVLRHVRAHQADIDSLIARVNALGRFVATLESLREHTLLTPNPAAGHDRVTAAAFIAYNRMFQALSHYVDVLLTPNVPSEVAVRAALVVYMAFNPDGWRQRGAWIPDNVRRYVEFGILEYLQAVAAGY